MHVYSDYFGDKMLYLHRAELLEYDVLEEEKLRLEKEHEEELKQAR